jgi:putative SbcD/Mre11-related phosphoesterase
MLSPVVGLSEIKQSIEFILEKISPKKIILLGDIAVSFKALSYTETSEMRKILEYLKKQCTEVILIKGNHDRFIEKLIESLKIPFVIKYEIHNYCCIHGDELIETQKDIIFMGHEHPAITISNGIRREKFKCFMKTEYKGKELYVLPSINNITMGTDIISEKTLSPYLNPTNISSAKVYLLENNVVLPFGKVKDL